MTYSAPHRIHLFVTPLCPLAEFCDADHSMTCFSVSSRAAINLPLSLFSVSDIFRLCVAYVMPFETASFLIKLKTVYLNCELHMMLVRTLFLFVVGEFARNCSQPIDVET